MSTCKNCKFWKLSFQKRGGYADCGKINMNSMVRENQNKDKAYIDAKASDDQGLDAVLMTGENFGCDLFEKKQDKT